MAKCRPFESGLIAVALAFVSGSSGASAWIVRGGKRGFAEPTRIEVAGAHQIELGDLDGDGQLEVVVSGASGLTVIRDPLGEPKASRALVATDGPLLLADLVDPPGLDLITSSYMQSRIHALGGPDWQALVATWVRQRHRSKCCSGRTVSLPTRGRVWPCSRPALTLFR